MSLATQSSFTLTTIAYGEKKVQMPSDLWGVTGTIDLALPDHVTGYLLLLLYSLTLAYILYRYRHGYQRFSLQQWIATAGLSLLSLLVSQLFPLLLSRNPEIVLTLFAAIPFLMAGAMLNPPAALLVGLATGLGFSLGQTHLLFDTFHFGFAAIIAASLMGQNYLGRLYHWLRHPAISGSIASFCMVVMSILSTFILAWSEGTHLTAMEQALFSAPSSFWPLFIEGALGGAVVAIILMGLPNLRNSKTLVVSPLERSLRKRLLSNFVLFAVLLTVSLVTIAFTISLNVSTKLVVNQMAHNTKIVSSELPAVQDHLQNQLSHFANPERLLGPNSAETESALRQLHQSDSFYRRLLLIDSSQNVAAIYPRDDPLAANLSSLEKEAVAEAFVTSTPKMATAVSKRDEHIISFIVPVHDTEGGTGAVLLGRVPRLSLGSLIVGLQGTVGQGVGFIVDDHSRIIAHADQTKLLEEWSPAEDKSNEISTEQTKPGIAYRTHQEQSGPSELVYIAPAEERAWLAVTTVPYAVVLNLALSIGGPLAIVLVLVMGVFYANLTAMGRDITQPITELVGAAKLIAAGGKWTPSPELERKDEIGQLGDAFNQMHRLRNKRMRELSLLLDVSDNVASNLDINQGMPAILRGALRGTGAAGARAVVLNPNGNYPLTFGQGPASDAMAVLDKPISIQLRHREELILATPAQMRAALHVTLPKLPIPALVAIPLQSHGRFQGVLWLGYRQPHGFDSSARTLLHTLAGYAAVLVENARLFALTEGGRRRLAAVLSSTTDAFIVTDQTDRVLLINPAMEQAFNLRASEATNRPIADVVDIDDLVQALTGEEESEGHLEFANKEGRIFYCSVNPIINDEGQALGRVAVLHDITHLKEIEQMKSEFVSTVSHDLRSPLTFMRGFADMLSMVGELNEVQEEYIGKILGGVDKMSQLVDDLLDLGRISAGVDLLIESVDLKHLLTELVTDHWHHAHLTGIKLQLEMELDELIVQGDKTLIRQAVENLLTNGFKYAPDSGPMTVRAKLTNGEVHVSIQDNGPGISKKEQLRLFEKFYRVRQRGTEQVKGTGLGLSIVKTIAERHGGDAWCVSEPGKGSTFYISFPVPGNQGEAVET